MNEEPPSSGSKLRNWLLVGLLVVGAGVGAFWLWQKSDKTQPVAPVAEPKPVEPPDAGAAPTVSTTDGEALMRRLGAELSRANELAKWLAEPDILRRLVAAVNLIAEGNSPRPVLGFLGPEGGFQVVKGKRLHASPKSFARYDVVARVLTSIDVLAAAKAYGRLKPYFDAAFAQIGRPGQSFDKVLGEAIDALTSTPIPNSEPALQEKGLVYIYVDARLEQLSAAQKHLLRMGPENARAIQDWLKKLKEAIQKPSL